MNQIERHKLLVKIAEAVQEDAEFLRDAIDSMTFALREKAVADRAQNARSSAALFDVLETIEPPAPNKFGHFRFGEVLETLEPVFGGTQALEDLHKKFGT
jgi:hypothetical protein